MKEEISWEKGVPQLLLRLPEAAVALSMSERKVWSLAQSGELPSFKSGNCRLFSVESLQQWIRNQLTEGGSSRGQV